MKNRILTLFVALSIGSAVTSCKDKSKEAEATAAEPVAETVPTADMYKVDTENSTIEWKGAKPTGEHFGTISIASGELTAEGNTIESGMFTIDMSTITALDVEGDKKENLEAHLKGTVEGKEGDFFNINEFPTAAFEITGITTNEASKTILSGNLTLKGIKKNVSFPVTVTTQDDTLSLVSETFAINRTEWGVNFGSKSVFDNLGDKFINDDIILTVKVKATK
ncbi:YceI family protein [Formosa sediminum]|uniref:YceI family protein n=1 Tax=Formosa sediminum TaxID=2594004 RepID=A0A516GQY1_9FLAO|nr:YceI family protein [Formosa sediminum]QDO93931.1 YceI family protein [Formosa sediminum]